MKRFSFYVFILLSFNIALADTASGIKNYQLHCASCHGVDRLGGSGLALLPGNLSRLKKQNAKQVISQGRAATQMAGFANQLSESEIDELVEYIYTPVTPAPVWSDQQITDSHIDYQHSDLSAQPVYEVADKLNMFIVVELGDHSASLLDGDKLEVIHRFKTRPALHGGPKFSSDGRYVYFASRDGWVSKFDIYNLKMLHEIRAGINTRNIAISTDGKTVLVGNYLPHNLVVLDADDLSFKNEVKVISGEQSSRVSAVYTAPPRNSYIVALKDIAEIWEIPYASANSAKPVPIRIQADKIIDDFFFSQDYKHLIGGSRDAGKGVVINLDDRKTVSEIELDGIPHLGSGFSFEHNGGRVLASQNLRKNEISFIDMRSWEIIKRLETPGPGFFMRSHEKSPYAMADVFFGEHKEKILVIDKQSLEIIKTLVPAPGKTSAHIEFDRHGQHALVSVWEDDGALIIYDMQTIEEIKRIPMKKPSGKYNIFNKIKFSEGTSH